MNEAICDWCSRTVSVSKGVLALHYDSGDDGWLCLGSYSKILSGSDLKGLDPLKV